MDRGSRINSKMFSKAHLDGVREFMDFVSKTVGENEEIWCPCRMCLNRIRHLRGIVEDHLLLHHMATTYTSWVYHGEPSDVGADGNAGHVDEHIGLNEDITRNEDVEDPGDRIPDMLEEMRTVEQHDGEKSIFAAVLEEMKKETYPGSPYTRFSLVAKLLHVKSFYRISNVGFTAMMKVLSSAFPACSIPESYDEAKKVVHALGLGYDSIHALRQPPPRLQHNASLLRRAPIGCRMPPGRKPTVPVEAPVTEYERERAQIIMRNNQVARSLGIGSLTSLLKQSNRLRKARGHLRAKHKNGKEGFVNEVSEENMPTHTVQSGGARSKRVIALEEPDQPARMTRQRTREQQLVQSSEEAVQESTTNAEGEGATQPDDEQTIVCIEGQGDGSGDRCRGISMGKELHRLTKGLTSKIPVHIAEGKKRPDAPMQAAKFASEGGIVLRQHIPILTHWKEYKKKENSLYLQEYMKKVSVNLAMDTTSKVVVDACADLLKSGQRQLRHKLKKYFDGKPANEVPTKAPVSTITDEQWTALVTMWSSAKHKDKYLTNKRSREKVRLPHRTGSRCYLAQLAVLKQEKYRDVPPTAIDVFKDFHCSSKTGFSEPVKEAIVQMEAIMDAPIEEGQVQKTPEEAVAQVLASTKFLENAGLSLPAADKTSKSSYAARVRELEAQLQAKEQDGVALQDKVDVLEQKLVESEVARDKEIEALKKHLQENDAILRRFFNVNN